MSATLPTGTMGLAKRHLRLAVADSTAFRTLVGATDQQEALNRIYIDDLPPPEEKASTDPDSGEVSYALDELSVLRPFALVAVDENAPLTRTLIARGSGNHYESSGRLTLHIEEDIPEAIRDKPHEIATRWENLIEAILEDITDVAGTAGYLDIQSYDIMALRVVHPERETAQGFYQYAICGFDWSGL